MMIDDDKIVKMIGISKELTEHSQCESIIFNDIKYRWMIVVHPATERNDLIYFKIYDLPVGKMGRIDSTKCARISITSPEYINCTDCSKETWILTQDELQHLCDILYMDNGWYWSHILDEYADELEFFNKSTIPGIRSLPIPDYSKLPTI